MIKRVIVVALLALSFIFAPVSPFVGTALAYDCESEPPDYGGGGWDIEVVLYWHWWFYEGGQEMCG